MYRVCIAVVDATRARLFRYERVAEPDGPREQLAELRDLVNPARRPRSSALFPESGSAIDHTGQPGDSFDDHRLEHMERIDDEFARAVAEALVPLTAGIDRVILCASPRMLGRLRGDMRKLHRSGFVVDQFPHDLVKLTALQIRDQLASYGALPPLPPRP